MAIVNNSDPQALIDIAKEIRRYADTLKSDVAKLVNRNRSIGSSWSGKQYDDFTEIIVSVKDSLDKQADTLCKIAADVDADAVALADAIGVKVRR